MSAALNLAQEHWDHLAPDEPEPFVQTRDGDAWLEQSADALISGEDVKIDVSTMVEAYKLSDAVAAYALKRIEDGFDDDGQLGQLLVAIEAENLPLAQSCLKALLGTGSIKQIGREICEPYGQQAFEQLRRDEEDGQ